MNVEDVILETLARLNTERGPDEQIPLSPATKLFGP